VTGENGEGRQAGIQNAAAESPPRRRVLAGRGSPHMVVAERQAGGQRRTGLGTGNRWQRRRAQDVYRQARQADPGPSIAQAGGEAGSRAVRQQQNSGGR